MVLGAAFLGIKGVEYYHKFVEHHVPGPAFQFEAEHFRHAQIFFSLYFVMTGLHALHMIIGLGIMTVMLVVVVARHDHRGLHQPDRDQRPLLALRRHRLDLPVPAAVPDRAARDALSGHRHVRPHRSEARSTTRSSRILMLVHGYLTVQVAFVDLGPLNTVVALAIAVFKATLVVLFFMHVKYSTRLTWAVVVGSVFWLGILLALTFSDYLTRHILTYG